MRPPGEIREALRAAFNERGAATWREVLPALPCVNAASPAEVRLVRRTVVNMVAAGELVPAGHGKVAGSMRWHTIYEVAAAVGCDADGVPQPWGGIEALAVVMRGFPGRAARDT